MAKKPKNFHLPGAKDHPEADYHETQECMPAMYLLGRISIEWNWCEHFISTLIWHYVGGTLKGVAVTAGLGNKSRADLLLNLARRFEKNKEFVDRIEFAASAFNRIRETRNILMHSHSVDPHESGKLEWRRTSSTALLGHVSSLAGVEDLNSTINVIAKLSFFVLDLTIYKFRQKKRMTLPPLPEKFPLPEKLVQLPQEATPTKKRQRSSQAQRKK